MLMRRLHPPTTTRSRNQLAKKSQDRTSPKDTKRSSRKESTTVFPLSRAATTRRRSRPVRTKRTGLLNLPKRRLNLKRKRQRSRRRKLRRQCRTRPKAK